MQIDQPAHFACLHELVLAAREPAPRVGDRVGAPECLRAVGLREHLLVAAAHLGEGVLHVVFPARRHDSHGRAHGGQRQQGCEKGPHFAIVTP